MFNLLVTAISPIVDGLGNVKILASVEARYFDPLTMPATIDVQIPDPDNPEGEPLTETRVNDGLLLASVQAAYDAQLIAQIFSQETHEAKMDALNQFVLSEAARMGVFSRESLERMRDIEYQKIAGQYVGEQLAAMLNAEIIYPARIPMFGGAE